MIHRDVCPAIAVVIANHGSVRTDAKSVAHVCRVVGAREQDVPLARGGTKNGDVRPAVAVVVAGNGNVRADPPLVGVIRRVARARPRTYQTPFNDRYTVMSAVPSPSKSPSIARPR